MLSHIQKRQEEINQGIMDLYKGGMEKTMQEFKDKTLKTGSGKTVTDRKQAIAIGLNQKSMTTADAPGLETVEKAENGMCPKCNVPMQDGNCLECGYKAELAKGEIVNNMEDNSSRDEFDMIVTALFDTQNLLEHCHRKTVNEPKHEALGEAYVSVAASKDAIIEAITALLGRQYNELKLASFSHYSPEMCNIAAGNILATAVYIQDYAKRMQFPSVENMAQDLHGVGAHLKYLLSLDGNAHETDSLTKGEEDSQFDYHGAFNRGEQIKKQILNSYK